MLARQTARAWRVLATSWTRKAWAPCAADAMAAAIQPGDLLSTTGQAGIAAKAPTINVGGTVTTVPGTVFGKALEPLDAGKGLVYVFVTLQ